MGLASILTGILIWKNYSKVLAFTLSIAVGHVSVLFSLLTIFNSVAADQSIKAMIFRSTVWLILLVVVWKSRSKEIYKI